MENDIFAGNAEQLSHAILVLLIVASKVLISIPPVAAQVLQGQVDSSVQTYQHPIPHLEQLLQHRTGSMKYQHDFMVRTFLEMLLDNSR